MQMYGVSGEELEKVFSYLREEVGDVAGDRETTSIIARISELIRSGKMLERVHVRIN